MRKKKKKELTFNERLRMRRKKTKRVNRLFKAGIGLFLLGLAAYFFVVFTTIPVVAKWRTIYIETAMSTKTHQWLATAFFPGYMVNEIVAKNQEGLNAQADLMTKWADSISGTDETAYMTPEEKFYYHYPELDSDTVRSYLSEHSELTANDYANVFLADLDHELGLLTAEGDDLLVIDTENNFVLIGLKGDDYYGKLAIVKDSAQVDLALSQSYGTRGEEVETIANNEDALIAINASRFQDIGGHGNGGTVKGALVKDGKNIGHSKHSFWKYCGVQLDGHLYIDSYTNVKPSKYRWGLEIYPALIVNGENVIDGTLGMGIQPRACIGQAENGDMMLLTVDGRQPGYAMGCDVQECANILFRYGAVQGMNLDGGSSVVMIYRGQMITKPCSVSGRGRYVPDALIIRKASAVESSDSTSESTHK